jgi:hypothetical protein
MLRPTKKMWARIGAVAVIGAAFASAAIAAETTGTLDTNVRALTAAASTATGNVSLPAAASQVATLVHDAITGDSSPSVAASRRSDDASAAKGKSGGEAGGLISAAQRMIGAGTAGTVGVRPGWGCGDTNHTHSGPPGRPDASPPPGCAR